MKMSIGIDVSKYFFDVAVYGKPECLRFDYTEKGIKRFVKWLSETATSKQMISMEATGSYYLKLATTLYSLGYEVSVINPLIIRKYSEMKMSRVKTDKADAKIIAEYGYYEKTYPFKPKDKERQDIELMLKAIDDLLQMKRQILNRFEAISQYPTVPELLNEVWDRLLDSMEDAVKELEKEIDVLIRKHYPEEEKYLSGIPGVGKRIIAASIAVFSSFENFENGKQVVSFVGLSPFPKESGVSVKYRAGISKKGNPYFRKLLYLGALSASRYNPQCKALYQRLLEKGKHKKSALVAVAHKLLRQIFGVLKNRRFYSKNYALA